MSALRPAMVRAVMDTAEQAALEVGARLPDHQIDVVFREGDPHLVVAPRPPVSRSPPRTSTPG